MAEIRTTEPKKGKTLARRERLHPDWPIKCFAYDCWPIDEIPKQLWDTAHDMRRLWNDFVAKFRSVSERDLKDEEKKPLLSKEERKILWNEISLVPLREYGKQYSERLDSACREFVINKFLVTLANWRKNAKRYGPPRMQYTLEKIHIPLDFNAGKSTEWITNGKMVSARDTLALKPKKAQSPSPEYLHNAHFCIGISRTPLNLHVAYAGRSGKERRFLPKDGRIKRVSLVGRKDSAFGWLWSLQVKLEHPPEPLREPTGRVCGWDSGGWRIFEDRVRIGVIADNAGWLYELSIPIAIGLLSRLVRNEIRHCETKGWEYDKPITWHDLLDLDSRYGLALEACKKQVKEVFAKEKDAWPEPARKAMSGIVKMRDTGLKHIRHLLDSTDSTAKAVIDEWLETASKLNTQIRAFENHVAQAKLNAYREINHWLNSFDEISWEGNLSLGDMAEDAGERKEKRKAKYEETGEWEERTGDERAQEASQKFRQWVGQSKLRELVKQKHRDRLLNNEAAFSTQICPECGGAIKQTGKLFLVCENGHKRDQDVSASIYLLNKIQTYTSISAPALEIPLHLRPYLRVMTISETELTLTSGL